MDPPQTTTSQMASGGFTLVELMVVVAIIAIMATVATVAYTRHLRSGRIVAAKAFVAQIKAGQETYFQQFGRYCDASAAGVGPLGNFHPGLSANNEPLSKSWTSGLPEGFSDLGVRPDGGRTFSSVFVHASIPTIDPTTSHQLAGEASPLGVPAQPVAAGAVPHPWYYIVSHLDLNGDQTTYSSGGCSGGISAPGCTVMTTTNVSNVIVVRNEGQ